MKRFIGLILVVAVTGGLAASSQARNGPMHDNEPAVGVELTYTKWFDPTFPNMVGVVGGDIVGNFGGAVLERTVAPDGLSAHLTAVYIVIAPDPSQSFTAHIEGTTDLRTGNAVLDGRVVDGWLKRAHVHAELATISCTQAPSGRCFQGTISVTRSFEH
ncbi:MAG: hypothetical protein ACRDKK_03950 [Gaiellaceae bacterium]